MLDSVIRTLQIIETIHNAKTGLTIHELAEILNKNRSTLHHQISTLVEMGYLLQDSVTRRYDIGSHLIEIGQRYLSRQDIRRVAHVHFERLSRQLDEAVNLLVLRNHELVYIDKFDFTQRVGDLKPSFYIGASTQAYATAAGKVLLASLSEEEIDAMLSRNDLVARTEHTITDPTALKEELKIISRRGFAMDNEEHQIGIKCIAVPLYNNRPQAVAAVSVSGPVGRFTVSYMTETILPELKETAATISRALGYSEHHY